MTTRQRPRRSSDDRLAGCVSIADPRPVRSRVGLASGRGARRDSRRQLRDAGTADAAAALVGVVVRPRASGRAERRRGWAGLPHRHHDGADLRRRASLDPLEERHQVRVVTAVVLIDAASRAAVADRRRAAGTRGGRGEDDAKHRADDGDEQDTGRDRPPATARDPLTVRSLAHEPWRSISAPPGDAAARAPSPPRPAPRPRPPPPAAPPARTGVQPGSCLALHPKNATT
jgi:hypothetical protein